MAEKNYPWRTNYNAKDLPKDYERNNEPSRTIPDQSLPIIEIVKRYANGQPLGGGLKNPIYHGEDSDIPPNWDKMDLSEKHDYKEANLQRVKDMQDDLQAQKAKTGKYKPKEPPKDSPEPNAASDAAQDSKTKNDKK